MGTGGRFIGSAGRVNWYLARIFKEHSAHVKGSQKKVIRMMTNTFQYQKCSCKIEGRKAEVFNSLGISGFKYNEETDHVR